MADDFDLEKLKLDTKEYKTAENISITIDDILREYGSAAQHKEESSDTIADKTLSEIDLPDEDENLPEDNFYSESTEIKSESIPPAQELKEPDLEKEISKPQIHIDEKAFDEIKSSKKHNAILDFAKGADEEDDDEAELLQNSRQSQPEPEEIDDYEGPGDREEILADLKRTYFNVSLKSILLLILSLLSAALLVFRFLLPQDSSFVYSYVNSPRVFVVVNLALTLITVFLCFGALWDGLIKLFTAKCTPDTYLALQAITVIGLDLLYIIRPAVFEGFSFAVFDFIFIFVMFCNLRGKRMILNNIKKNFVIAAADGEKNVLRRPRDDELTNDLIIETGRGDDIVYNTKCSVVTGIIENSYMDFKADKPTYTVSFAAVIITLVLAAGLYFLRSSFTLVLLFLTAAFAISSSFFGVLHFAIPICKAGKKARKQGAVIVGSSKVDEFEDEQLLIVDESDIFHVALNGIKVMGNYKIDEAIINISAIFNRVGGPLKKIFMDMLENDQGLLPRVDDLYYHDSLGYSCLINSKIFLVGNSGLMKHFGIETEQASVLDNVFEDQAKSVLFAAYNGKLVAVFILSYSIDDWQQNALAICQKEDISIALAEHDFNIDSSMLKKLVGEGYEQFISILSYKTSTGCFKRLAYTERQPAVLVSTTGLKGIVSVLSIYKRLGFALKSQRVVKILSSFIGIGLISFITFTSTPGASIVLHILIYQLIWSALLYFISVITK